MSADEQPSDALRRAVTGDLRPVRPLARPWRRTAAIAPLAALLLLAVPWWFGQRDDAGAIGIAWTWGASVLQLAYGIWLIGTGLREAVPGRSSATSTLVARVSAAALILVGVTMVTYAFSPTAPLPERYFAVTRICLFGSATVGVPLLVAVALLAARAYPLRPSVVGMLCGLGAGLVADSGWRLFCAFSDPVHVLLAHGGAIVALALGGAGFAHLLARWQRPAGS